MGKGSKRRPTNEKKYANNWDAIFKKKPSEESNGQITQTKDAQQ